jgi:hypothetical protein|uniref:Uncharacterized protein n=1 Tax=Eutreptiella gymnastica TaxID=73025 RepID=A0A7S4D358_9EUGL|mmetsp:Transcript_12755/g.23177  ORF Transcript_12755/g.23177 Transcript_12755/m.23177 type:complete len:106 (-) Transcript_12755:420-737(-)
MNMGPTRLASRIRQLSDGVTKRRVVCWMQVFLSAGMTGAHMVAECMGTAQKHFHGDCTAAEGGNSSTGAREHQYLKRQSANFPPKLCEAEPSYRIPMDLFLGPAL